MTPSTTYVSCPHHNCPYAFQQIKGHQSEIRQHLTTLHTFEQNQQLNQSVLHKLHCYPCPKCHLIFATIGKQKSHIDTAHPSTRQQTNLDIILQTYPGPPTNPPRLQAHQHAWTHSLQWLHSLEISPPTARISIYTKMAYKQKQTFLHTLHHVITWCNKATLPHQSSSNLPSFQ